MIQEADVSVENAQNVDSLAVQVFTISEKVGNWKRHALLIKDEPTSRQR